MKKGQQKKHIKSCEKCGLPAKNKSFWCQTCLDTYKPGSTRKKKTNAH